MVFLRLLDFFYRFLRCSGAFGEESSRIEYRAGTEKMRSILSHNSGKLTLPIQASKNFRFP
jgi:hypothetical protein